VLGPDHPLVAITLNNLAMLYQAQGRTAAGVALPKRALSISETAQTFLRHDLAAHLPVRVRRAKFFGKARILPRTRILRHTAPSTIVCTRGRRLARNECGGKVAC
jgi:hypothetical protein